jgi:hypothetical protein
MDPGPACLRLDGTGIWRLGVHLCFKGVEVAEGGKGR